MTINELIGKIAARAGQLADEKTDTLRAAYPEPTETAAELIRYCKESRFSRGEMIDAILLEEFSEEDDYELERP